MPREISRRLLDHPVELLGDPADLRLQLGQVRGLCGLRQAQLEAERDQSLLGAVVQVALEAAPGVGRGGDDPGPGRGESS